MNVFDEIHKDIPREGPGDTQSTKRAFQMLSLSSQPRILDIGCGPGAQTIDIASMTDVCITAVDTNETFLQRLQERARILGLDARIQAEQGSMFTLDQVSGVQPGTFDVIWSEGAIYIMGFENGLCSWWPYLKDGGYVAVTELTWITEKPSREAVNFWDKHYPKMCDIHTNCRTIVECGYQLIGHFTLPESAWWKEYYLPMVERIRALQETYATDPSILQQLAQELEEVALYKTSSDSYGYVFYIMRKAE